jgi:CobQ-like glutamine amidotransferase family enzyme
MRELKILYLYPDILELYGDFGNIQILKYRLEKRGILLNNILLVTILQTLTIMI